MLARDISALHPNAKFVVDVKSTGLFKNDPVLERQWSHNGLLEDWALLHQALQPRHEISGWI